MKTVLFGCILVAALTGCNQTGVALNFANQKKIVMLEGAQIDRLCTPTFRNLGEEEQVWDEVNRDPEKFRARYCPDISNKSESVIRYFSYYTDTGSFQEWNPGGYEEMGLYTSADIEQITKNLTQEPYDANGLTLWSSCTEEERILGNDLTARAVTCTNYRSDYPNGNTTQPRETFALVPNTDCFVFVDENLYFGFRIPMATLDAGSDGCEQLKKWGIHSIRLK